MRTLKKKFAETKEKFLQILRAFTIFVREHGGKRKAQKIELYSSSGGFYHNEKKGILKG